MISEEFYKLMKDIEEQVFVESELTISFKPTEQEFINDLWYGIDHYSDDDILGLHDEKVIMLVKALKKNPYITKLDLRGENIGDIGAIALASVSTLKEIILDNNCIGHIGAMALLARNLNNLSLKNNLFKEIELDYKDGKEPDFSELVGNLENNYD